MKNKLSLLHKFSITLCVISLIGIFIYIISYFNKANSQDFMDQNTKSYQSSSDGPISGIYYGTSFPPSIVIEEDKVTEERCKRDGWAHNPRCCCTSNWCHPVPCEKIRFNGDGTATVELKPGDHPNIIYHIIWDNVESFRLHPSPDADKGICYVCAGSSSISCVLYLPGGIM